MPTIKVPPVLRPQTDGEAEVSVEGGTVGDALRALAERYPSTKDQLFSPEGELNRYVNVYLNDEDVRVLDGLDTGVVGVGHRGDPAGDGGRLSALGPARGSAWCAPPSGSRSAPCAGPSSTITPSSMNTTRSPTSRAKPISWVTTIIVMPSSARARITSSTSLDQLGVERARSTSSNSISFGSMASARAIATRCCWPPESRAG